MPGFDYTPLYPLGADNTEYRQLTADHVSSAEFQGASVVKVEREALVELSRAALSDVNYLFRTRHLASLRSILDDPEASANDRYVALTLLKNAVISSARQLPSCQDTGTAKVYAGKGQQIWTGFDDAEALSEGIWRTYTGENLRYSQNAALTMYEEVNTGSNLPAQIDIHATPGDAYKFLFLAKGGGSANKMYLFQETKAILNPATLPRWLEQKLRMLGTAACPPYHLALVIGGFSAENTMKTLKLASAGYLDNLPTAGNPAGHAFRDLEMEKLLLELSRGLGIGAQFGGKYFAHDARVIRLPRHGASLPMGLGVSCSADRNILGKITAEGVFLEQLEADPARFLPEPGEDDAGGDIAGGDIAGGAVAIDLNRPMSEIRAELSRHPIKTRVMLSGKMIVARDIAHARFKEMLDKGEELPAYFKEHPVYYAGPAKTPQGMPSGSFGPTTAARMDPYVDEFQARGASMVMLAKGNRSQAVTDACKKHGGFYLGSIGGPAALLAHDNIKNVEQIDFADLGMESVWEITVKNFPAFIIVDDKGNDFFSGLI